MKFTRLLPILTLFLVVSCIFFTGGCTAPPPATEAVTEAAIETGTEEATEEVVEPELSPVLPAPVFFLSGDDGVASLWRIEVDGVTLTSIKDCCIRDYAVSPATGQIAYVTDEPKLVITDANGEGAIEVILGEVSYPQELDSALAWSPDGLQLAFGGENGLWVYMLESERLFQISGTAEYTTFIRPLAYDAWSPSGSKILIAAHKPNADVDEIGMIPIVSGEVKMASILAGRRATWAPDEGSFYISSNFYGMMGILPSLIVVTTDDMEPKALVKSSLSEDRLGRYLEGAQVGPDDLLYYFYGEGPVDFEKNATGLSMYRSNRDGVTDRVALRTDTYSGISEILWAEDMSLAVIAGAGKSPNNQSGIITILPTNGEMPAIVTPFGGYGLQWGQAVEPISTSSPTTSAPMRESTPTTSPGTSTQVNESTDTPQADPDTEEYAVYNALLESEFKGDSIDQILIIDHTRVNKSELLEKDLSEFQENIPLAPELVASFKERNQQPYPLKPGLNFGLEYQLLTQEEVDELHPLDEASGWKLLYEKYPNSYGFVYLSRVGFNADFSQALVYISAYHYEQPIEGGYYLMTKQDGRWVVEIGYEWIT